jgi:hypothetical protein
MASLLRVPLFLLPAHDTSYPSRFIDRLKDAAQLQQIIDPQSLLVIAIDAADNSVSAARKCQPPEQSFVVNFLKLGAIPANVVFILTARTGRLDLLEIPKSYTLLPVSEFSKKETIAHVASYWPGVSSAWIEEFHELSSHNPRVQYYALDASHRSNKLSDAMQYMLPGGKGLNQVFRQQIEAAIIKSGSNVDIKKFCAAVVVLARPIPLSSLQTFVTILHLASRKPPTAKCHLLMKTLSASSTTKAKINKAQSQKRSPRICGLLEMRIRMRRRT